MRPSGRATVLAVMAASALATGSAASAAGIGSANGSTRSRLVHAFVVQDGSSAGIYGVYASGSAGVVCQKTPDAGKVRFLFNRSGRSWRFAFLTTGNRRGSSTQRRLEAACR